MSDFEKNRAEYVTHLETLVKNLQQQVADLKADERWIPQVGSEMDTEEAKARLTLAFGGKRQTVVMSHEALRMSSIQDISTSVMDAMENMVKEQLRTFIQPEIARLQAGAQSIQKAGKW